jgi:hypothetical protein
LHFEVRTISDHGDLRFQGERIFVTEALRGQSVGLEEVDEHLWVVHFYRFVIGKLDTALNTFI